MQPTLKTAPKVGLVDLVPILLSREKPHKPVAVPVEREHKLHYGKRLQAQSAFEIKRAYEAVIGKMTLTEISKKLGTHENTTYKRLMVLVSEGKLHRTIKQPFLYSKI